MTPDHVVRHIAKRTQLMGWMLISALVVLLLGSAAVAQSDQATMAARPRKVKQGEQVTIQVKVSPAPNVPGRIDVYVAPEGSTSLNINGGNGVGAGQEAVGEIGITIPIDAKLGDWRVIKIVFQPGSSAQHDLAISGSTTFEVIRRETVLPTSAEVQLR